MTCKEMNHYIQLNDVFHITVWTQRFSLSKTSFYHSSIDSSPSKTVVGIVIGLNGIIITCIQL